ncbi:sigma-70 family RNA polymerase sigma factor [bacterium]|nr:sigma-70 family RNA polymerase sigma factor [bacterium]
MQSRLADFDTLILRLTNGDKDAPRELVERFGPHIIRAIRRRFRTQKMRTLYETEDCLQSVWASIFSDLERLRELESPQQLVNYLATVAANKLVDNNRRHSSQKNNVGLETSVESEADAFEMEAADPSPSQMAAARDEWDHQTKKLTNREKTVLSLHLAGHSSGEIAQQMDVTSRGIRQMIAHVSDVLLRRRMRPPGE